MSKIKYSKHLFRYAALLAGVLCYSCYQGDDSPCSGADRFAPFRSNSFIDVYRAEPVLHYLRMANDGSRDTLTIRTRLDTLYLPDGGWSNCEYCARVYEVIQVQFLSDRTPFEMTVSFSSCSVGEALVAGRRYPVYESSGYRKANKLDSLLMNDSLGMHYYVRDSQYRLLLLP